ncbi:cobalt-precorrin-6A reductase [Novosphingobium sp. SG720]|uniref:cobalt-precorrin-6A reductase n=1 Tax=Novosphingobium sp. SG720 TaxID=2586998 RepID=UPI00144773A6|nr:cobalt-precorrin-6A reductase [Novosphingobium sp. SG720]NKJ43722.1 precorrin-6A/cobalt-precorrin-6A reductase [Novosphingobium sp. SG720]
MPEILILGGTTEASALAQLLAARGLAATLSYAGRTQAPRAQPVPVRIGGFGGVEGLAAYLREHGVTHLVDATHPFAAQMSAHAVAAAQAAGVPLIALTRPAWQTQPGDAWTRVADVAGAVDALAGPARRVLLALGRMHVAAFAAQGQHHYVLRFVDTPDAPPPLPDHTLVVDRGPFTVEGDMALLQRHAIGLVVCKNAGGSGVQAKLIAARALGLPMIMIDRPDLPPRHEVHDPQAVLDWIAHAAAPSRLRGV